jgi:Cof subfamily protein (haloacid dehalogenase superfamily)
MYKLVALDVDGTLLDSNHELSIENETALKELIGQGVHVILATGKQYVTVAQLINRLGMTGPQITSEGAIITDPTTGEVLQRMGVPVELASQVIDIGRELNTTIVISSGDKTFAREMNEDIEYLLTYGDSMPEFVPDLRDALEPLPTHLMMITYQKDDLFLAAEARFRRDLDQSLRIHRSVPYYLNFVYPEVSKGRALRDVCALLHLDLKETLVIGDSPNDVPMFQVAGCAVAMGNSAESVKQHAHYVTASNDQSGVAQAIHHLILS